MPKGRICPESGKATGLLEVPKRRRTCLLCGTLVGFQLVGEHLVVKRHWPRGYYIERIVNRSSSS